MRSLELIPPWEWPADTGARLLAALEGPADPADRLIAAALAGDLVVIDDALARALVKIVRSGEEPAELRATAAIALGPVLEHTDIHEFDDPDDSPITAPMFVQILATLQAVHDDESAPLEVRRRALEAAVRAPREWHREAIARAWGSTEDWRLTAVFCMRFVRGFEAQIEEALDSPDPEILLEAVHAAGTWELSGAWPQVRDLARSDETELELRCAAILAIATLRPEEALEVLGDLLDHEDPEVADAANEALVHADIARGVHDDDWDDDECDVEVPF